MEQSTSSLESLLSALDQIDDYRASDRILYPLREILFQALCSVMSNATHWSEMEVFGESKLPWLRQFLPYEKGYVRADTIRRTFSYLNPKTFASILYEWLSREIEDYSGKVLNIDGKRLANSVSKREQQTAKEEGGKQCLNLVQIWSDDYQLCMAQAAAPNSDELGGIHEVLDLVDISGSIVTIDAIGANKKLVQKLRKEKEVDYIIRLKRNQGNFHKTVGALFKQIIDHPESEQAQQLQTFPTHNRGHGRIETRVYQLLPASFLPTEIQEQWTDIHTLIAVDATRESIATGERSEHRRYYISSLQEPQASYIGDCIRQHWAIENQLHWTLDVYFREDKSTKRDKHAAQNYGALLRVVTSILKQKKTKKLSLNRMKLKCALSDEYRYNILVE